MSQRKAVPIARHLDVIDENLSQACAVADLIQAEPKEPLADDTLSNAAWLIGRLIREAKKEALALFEAAKGTE